MKPKMPFKISPSSIGLMLECERCFWLEKHKVWERPEGIFPTLPRGMDKILKIHFDSFRDKGKLPPELCDNKNCENLRLFGENEEEKNLLSEWRNNLKGISWQDKEGNILVGAIDNILVKGHGKNKKLIVLDYKTRGFELKEDTHKYYQHQLDIYSFLLRKNGYESEDYGFLLFYIPEKVLETGEFVFNSKLLKLEANTHHAENLFKKAVNLLKQECPKECCEWCERV